MSSQMRKVIITAEHPLGLFLDDLTLTAVGEGEGLQISLTPDEAAGLSAMLLQNVRRAAVEADAAHETLAVQEVAGHA